MDNNVALIVVFNHRFDKNLPKLRQFYAEKFTNVFFLMPFYDGNDEDVIPVYGSSDNFQAFFAQAYQHLKGKDFDFWLVVADDMVINPELNERNIGKRFDIGIDDTFFPSINQFHPDLRWPHAAKSLSFTVGGRYAEIAGELPSVENANSKIQALGLASKGLRFENIYNLEERSQMLAVYGSRFLVDEEHAKNAQLLHSNYPLVFGYSDIFCLGKNTIERFSHYCGAFSAAKLFVEIAIPTAIVLATSGKIANEQDIGLRGKALWTL